MVKMTGALIRTGLFSIASQVRTHVYEKALFHITHLYFLHEGFNKHAYLYIMEWPMLQMYNCIKYVLFL